MNSFELTEALRASGEKTDDCPDLFRRVATGVERRHRRHRTVAGVALVVTVGLAVSLPALAAGAGGSAVSASGEGCTSDRSLPSNSFLRRAEALAGTTCSSAAVIQPAPIAWHHTARRYGLEQP